MATYVALLRGINVGGRTKIEMAALRQVFTDLGLADVRTYLQSGNVIFTCPDGEPSDVAADIEKRIAEDLGMSTTVLLRTGEELARVVAGNPFLDRESDVARLHVTFLAGAPAADRSAGLRVPAGQPDEFSLVGREIYLRCPNGYGRTRLTNTFIEKRLGVAATTRNWNTVTKLRDLASE